MWPGNYFQTHFNFHIMLCKKESEGGKLRGSASWGGLQGQGDLQAGKLGSVCSELNLKSQHKRKLSHF